MLQNITILTSDAGFGHRKAAEAVAEAIKEIYADRIEAEIVNPLADSDLPSVIKSIETGYDEMVTEDPRLYQFAYAATDAPFVTRLLHEVATTALNDTMKRIILSREPGAILVTYPAFTQAAIQAARQLNPAPAVDVIVTDLVNVHSIWFHEEATMTFTPTGYVYRQGLDQGIDKSRVHMSGLPVHPDIARETRSKAELRQALGWDKKLPTALIVGSTRSKATTAITRLLDRSGLEMQIVAVAGGDNETEAELRRQDWQGSVHVYGMVNSMPQFMRAADFIVCKAGGLIVSEALACGLPMILYEALPGQEVGNVRYVVESGAGVWSPGPIGVLTTVYSWLVGDPGALAKHRRIAKQLGRPRAAYDIAERAFKQITERQG